MFEKKLESGLKILSFPAGLLQCNCSLLYDPATKEALVVDPGGDFPKISRLLDELDLHLKAILHTHAHFDHVGASKDLREKTKAPLCLHPQDRWLWEHVPEQVDSIMSSGFGMKVEALPAWDRDLEDELEFEVGGIKVRTLFTPGHTPGSCSFEAEEIVFAGDTLFQNSIGRTDLWGGDFSQIQKSIQERLYTLDDDTVVICGHGPHTLIGREKRSNPFVSA